MSNDIWRVLHDFRKSIIQGELCMPEVTCNCNKLMQCGKPYISFLRKTLAEKSTGGNIGSLHKRMEKTGYAREQI